MSETQHLQPSDQASKMSIYFAQVWKRRHFIWVMTSERFRSRNLDTYLGKIWNVLNPLLTVLVYYLIFGVVLGVNRGIENFALWLTIGVFSFRFTQASVIQASSSISSRIGLVRALKFPRLALPISSVLGELLAVGNPITGLTGQFDFSIGLSGPAVTRKAGDCDLQWVD